MLRPAFVVDIERATWTAELEGGAADIVLDRGSVIADGAEEAVSEVELELTAGSAATLFDLARRIGEAVPVRLGVLTKAERGHHLLAGRPWRAVKAELLSLSTAGAFAMIVETCLRQFG